MGCSFLARYEHDAHCRGNLQEIVRSENIYIQKCQSYRRGTLLALLLILSCFHLSFALAATSLSPSSSIVSPSSLVTRRSSPSSTIATAIQESLAHPRMTTVKAVYTALLYPTNSPATSVESLSNALYQRYERAILNKQIWTELQKHHSEVISLLAEVGFQIIFYFRNLYKGYILGLSLLIPFSNSIDSIHRVPLNDPYLLSFYNLPEDATPSIYGLDYSNVEVPSSDEKALTLHGWLVPATVSSSKKAMVCVHGFFSNRQACLPFLQIAHKKGIIADHHTVLMDLRNTGASTTVRRDLGIDGAADLFDMIVYMKKHLGITSVSLYSQSMGSMAVMLLATNYKEKLSEMGITLDRIIMDSPVVNVKEALRTQISGSPVGAKMLQYLFDVFFPFLNRRGNYVIDDLRASHLFSNLPTRKTLILQSKEDPFISSTVLRNELRSLDEQTFPSNVYFFQRGSHGNLQKDNRKDYESLIQRHFQRYNIPSCLRRSTLSKGVQKLDTRDCMRSG
ncbi:hypothetical protein IE077_003832 [Cardiosporidium cionae]|uniref:AB hydrolase-1 domain-containing protein n=1 Tax=Cardiosporidium cionae TaxID=476202 RepID=A0ABQ7JET8_9APIC|nr:hypothetical protein IE077_003832 [Cardiosporidium cionae]|eukprot:KAF8822405.1 hypothetical protein IE077_003832 [Cardiosporidium cionae]